MAFGNAPTAAQESPRDLTMNERLGKAAEAMQYQCERIEAVLSRVNGTPQKIDGPGKAAVPIRPTMPLSQNVEHLEALYKRLSDLATGVEQIA